jgi:serine protease Do
MKTTFSKLVPHLPRVLLTGAVLLAIANIAASDRAADKTNSAKAPPVSLAVDDRPVARDGKLGFSFSPVVKKVTPSVVKITATMKGKEVRTQEVFPGMDDPFFRRFFGDNPGRNRVYRTPPQRGVGSGVIVTKDGYILTNNHVVDDADSVKISLQDGREFTAKVVGKDPKTDVAVLRVDAKDLPAIDIADSDKIEIGDLVLAVGNPFDIGQTVTMGLVSATSRGTLGLDYEDFIQTDAAINPGNSGGALVDAEGRLIGINTAILSRSGGNQGIGFAIPVNLARDVMNSLVTDGKVTRGYFGVMIQDVTPALARELDLKQRKGALVGDVVPKSPADKAGIKTGDVVIELNGKPVTDSRHLKLAVARAKPGETVHVKVLRDGSNKALDVTVKELPEPDQLAKSDSQQGDEGEALKGVAVADLDPQTRRQFKIPDTVRGVIVKDVEPGSAAAESGLQPGDVILEINKHPVKDAEDAVRLTASPKDKSTLLRLWRQGGSRFLVVDESNAG